MRRWIAVSIVVFSIILASTVQAGGFFKSSYFIGLWQGIDTVDGSEAQRSITLNRDGTFNISGREEYFSACNGYRGILKGKGMFVNGVVVSEEFELTCIYETSAESTKMPVMYIPDKHNGTLRERWLDGTPDDPIRTTYHKVSNN